MNILKGLFGRKQESTPPPYVPNSREPCPNCGCNDWRDSMEARFEVLNPNGEFVKGYGHSLVMKQVGVMHNYHCTSCGWLEGGNPIVIDPWEGRA